MSDIVYPVNFHLLEILSQEVIEGAFISIWDGTFTILVIPNITTDASGFATIGLPAGIYNAVFFMTGFTFPRTVFFHVTDTPMSFTVEGDVSIVSPIVRGYCLLYGYIKDVSNKPIIDTKVRVRINPNPQYNGSQVFSKENYNNIYTNENGYFEVSLLGGTKVTITIPECGYQTTGVLPTTGRIDVTSLDKQFTIK
jgi:hypothetical protein